MPSFNFRPNTKQKARKTGQGKETADNADVTREQYIETRSALVSALHALDRAWHVEREAASAGEPQYVEFRDLAAAHDPASPPDFDSETPFQPLWSHKAIIIHVAKRMRGVFGVDQVKAAIDQIGLYRNHAPAIRKATISGRLRNMVTAGFLELVDKGTGSRPSLYRVRARTNPARLEGVERDQH